MATSRKSRTSEARAREHLAAVLSKVERQQPSALEFHQAVRETARSLVPVLVRKPLYMEDKIFERLVEPDRVISFGVTWVDDRGDR